MYKKLIKPIIDFSAALIALCLLFPFLLLITILLLVIYKGNAFFIQVRPGKSEKLFSIIKFKTMNDNKVNGKLLDDSERITGIGKFIRKTSIDELPQLINILKGDMSLIGPRPLLPQYLPLYSKEQQKRHQVKPGLTGWAQVNGRNALQWQNKLKLDVWYVNNLNFLLDVKIIFLTIKKVFTSDGVSSDGSTSVGRFKGNQT